MEKKVTFKPQPKDFVEHSSRTPCTWEADERNCSDAIEKNSAILD